MKNLSLLTLALFISQLAYSSGLHAPIDSEYHIPSNPPSAIVSVHQMNKDKTLDLVVLDSRIEEFTLAIEPIGGEWVYEAQVKTKGSEVLKIDLSSLRAGIYMIKVSKDEIVQQEEIIIPSSWGL